MTTNSARPEQLRGHAARLRAQADEIDAAVRAVATQQATYRDGCADGHVAGSAALLARNTEQQVAALARGLLAVASAFEQADSAPAPLQMVTDRALASALARMAPALATDPDIHRAAMHERGRRVGAELGQESPAEVRRRLASLGLGHLDPSFAAGLLAGLGTKGLGRLAVDAQRDASTYVERPEDEAQLWSQLAAVADAAGRTVHPVADPWASPVVDPGGLDLGLVDRLARSWQGRLALRNLAEHLRRPPTVLTVALADALLLGPTARDDLMSGVSHRGTAGVTVAPGTAGEVRALDLLATDPIASLRLELLHHTGASPAVLLLQRDRMLPRRTAAATNLRNVVTVSVQRGWALPWADPVAGTAGAYERTTVPRVLHQLIPMVVGIDHLAPVSHALSRALADAAQTHPTFFTVAAAKADVADSAAGRVAVTGYFAALARDRRALDQAAVTFVGEYRAAIGRSVANHPPGSATAHDLLLDASASLRPLQLLVDGAHEAGRQHHVGVVVATTIGAKSAQYLLPAVGARFGGPIGAVVGKQAGKAAEAGTDHYREDHEDTWDGREQDAEEEIARQGPVLGARAMLGDPVWSPLLHFPPGGLSPEQLCTLDVSGSTDDRSAFAAWRKAQDPTVREVLQGLS
jgi:hypothetical protein